MKIENVLAQIDFIDYVVTVYSDANSRYRSYNPERHKLVATGNYNYTLTRDIARLCDDSFLPNQGDEIHVVPGCPIPTQDLRNNYKLKRGFDEGVCNVFSELGRQTVRRNYDCFLFNNEHKIVIISDKVPPKKQPFTCAQKFDNVTGNIPEEFKNLNFGFYDEELTLDFYSADSSYIDLIMNTNKKPCVHYSKLKMKRNEITLDILNMLYSSCRKKESTIENIDNIVLVLSTISQYNWRDYPLTMHYLFYAIQGHSRAYSHIARRINGMPKAIRDIVKEDHWFTGTPTENDFNMCRDFLNQLFGLDGTKFVSLKDLEDKVCDSGISMDMFCNMYHNTVRIVQKEYGKN